MRMHQTKPAGFSLIEIILAIAVFGMLSSIIIGTFVYGRQSSAVSVDRTRAVAIANEGMEAVRNVANPTYSNLSAYTNGTTYYLSTSANQWSLSTTPSTIDSFFTRTIVFADGPNGTRQATINVSWQQTPQRTGLATVVGYFANWRQSTAPPNKTGIFVYANGGTTTDTMSYKILQSNGTWTAALAMPDVDPCSTNRVARSVKLYSAQTGSTKVVMSRHFNGTTQYVYASVWNGTTWGNTQLLGTINSSGDLDIGNYGGAFLANGTFVGVYSDGTNVPKYRLFNGTTWSAQGSLPALGNSSDYITNMAIQARPSTNEAMAIFLGNNSDVDSSYFANNTWSAMTVHTTVATSNGSKLVDVAWSSVDNTKAAIVYAQTNNPTALTGKIFTANGTGSGTFSSALISGTTTASIMSVGVAGRHASAVEFEACSKNTNATPDINCYKLTGSGFTSPTNQLITSNTDPGGQRSFDIDWKYLTANIGLIAYSDDTASGKLKRFNSTTNSWDATPIALNNASGEVQKTRIVAKPNSNDAMIIVADANENLSTVMLNGTSDLLYTTPTGQAWTVHNTNGPSNNAVWFDFAWDN